MDMGLTPPPLMAQSVTFCYAFLCAITISEQYFLLYVCIVYLYFLLGARKNKYAVLAEGLDPSPPPTYQLADIAILYKFFLHA